MNRIETFELDTPLGRVRGARHDGALVALGFADCDDGAARAIARLGRTHGNHAVADEETARAMARYWAGDVAALDALAVAPAGTEFQQQVWAELRRIPPGERVSYLALATRLGRPSAVRAVAAANAANPIALAIPCHRVIGADGSLTGYAGGLERKARLLEHEGALAGSLPEPATLAS